MNERLGVSAISLVSYDYRFLLDTIPRYLPFVDEVLLGIDSDGLTWAGERFAIPALFFDELRRLDQKPPKIRLVRRSFYSASRSPMENEVAERNALSLEIREGNWIVSIDADEYLLNPEKFFLFLRGAECGEAVSVEARLITIFKDLGDALLIIAAQSDGELERFRIATRQRGAFVLGRVTEAPLILSPAIVLHYSWGREEGELLQKLLNWGHSQDFDVRKFFEFWRGVNEENYSGVRNFHPIWPDRWSRLVMVGKADLDKWHQWALGGEAGPWVGRRVRRLWLGALRLWHGRRP